MMAAREGKVWWATREVCLGGHGRHPDGQRRPREGGRRSGQMADGFVVPLRPGNAGGGKEPCPGTGEESGKTPEIGPRPTNSARTGSEAADFSAGESYG